MFQRDEVLRSLRESGIQDAIKWAFQSAVRRSLETYDERDGHDGTWLGITRHVLFRNRLDRVFSCQQYTTASTQDEEFDNERYARLSELDQETMPNIPPGKVNRANLNGSPGWSFNEIWFLISSAEFRKFEKIRWADKSLIKQLVAAIPNPDPSQPEIAFEGDDAIPRPVFVVAHSLESVYKDTELAFGKPRDNSEEGSAWNWLAYLISPRTKSAIQAGGTDIPLQGIAENVPDAPVRLRNTKDKQIEDSAGG